MGNGNINRQQRRKMERDDKRLGDGYTYLVVPLQIGEEFVRLFKEIPADIIDTKHVGLFLTPHDLERGISRWKKAGRPNPFEDPQLLSEITLDKSVIAELEKANTEYEQGITKLTDDLLKAETRIKEKQQEHDRTVLKLQNTHAELTSDHEKLKETHKTVSYEHREEQSQHAKLKDKYNALERSKNLQETQVKAKDARISELEQTLGAANTVINAYTNWLAGLSWLQNFMMQIVGGFSRLSVPDYKLPDEPKELS